jgi:hypothetical protein
MIFFSRSRKESPAKSKRKAEEVLKDSRIELMTEEIRVLRHENFLFRNLNILAFLKDGDADIENSAFFKR